MADETHFPCPCCREEWHLCATRRKITKEQHEDVGEGLPGSTLRCHLSEDDVQPYPAFYPISRKLLAKRVSAWFAQCWVLREERPRWHFWRGENPPTRAGNSVAVGPPPRTTDAPEGNVGAAMVSGSEKTAVELFLVKTPVLYS